MIIFKKNLIIILNFKTSLQFKKILNKIIIIHIIIFHKIIKIIKKIYLMKNNMKIILIQNVIVS